MGLVYPISREKAIRQRDDFVRKNGSDCAVIKYQKKMNCDKIIMMLGAKVPNHDDIIIERRGLILKKISIRYRAIIIILALLIPFILLFHSYTGRVKERINLQLAKGYQEALLVFCTDVEEQMKTADAFLMVDCWSGEDFRRASEVDTAEAAEAVLSGVKEKAQILLENNQDISGIFFYSEKAGKLISVYYEDGVQFAEKQKEAMETVAADLYSEKVEEGRGWQLKTEAGRPLMARTVSYQGLYCTAMIDLQRLTGMAQTEYKLSAPVAFAKNGEIITDAYWMRNYDGDLSELIQSDGHNLIESGGVQYLVITDSVMGQTALYGVRYNYRWDWMNLMVWGFAAVVIFTFALVWFSMEAAFFRPLRKLIRVMEAISNGDLTARAEDFSGREFAEINGTFNQMVDTIEHLKLQTYENQIQAKTSQMNALRLQIRRHFFLNCLKNIYAMARSGNVENIQKMVLLLSVHLRYTLDVEKNTVSLAEELDMCRNYTELQGVGQSEKPELKISMDERLKDFYIPPVSLLTLIENCCKYAMEPGKSLEIKVEAAIKMLDEDRYVDLTVQDNGPGFADEMLKKLNTDRGSLAEEGHIGICNVLERIRMMYGRECSMIFGNAGGANIEIIIPLERGKDI